MTLTSKALQNAVYYAAEQPNAIKRERAQEVDKKAVGSSRQKLPPNNFVVAAEQPHAIKRERAQEVDKTAVDSSRKKFPPNDFVLAAEQLHAIKRERAQEVDMTAVDSSRQKFPPNDFLMKTVAENAQTLFGIEAIRKYYYALPNSPKNIDLVLPDGTKVTLNGKEAIEAALNSPAFQNAIHSIILPTAATAK
uniref:Uncharacterized protein n=1 Tax=Plectus sambesii TaxID=2011161 RepID=A0A914WMI4_9BILA